MKQLLVLLAAVSLAAAGTISPDLEMMLAGATDTDLIPVFILAHGQVDRNWVDAATDGMNRAQRQEFAV
ncbi:MAG TPA: hypothetical protein P5207_01185, partial [Candidatus Sabulitectum sp.]|nr:hypothetical protein [Candidatus Sabulitectum sp.]